MAVCVCGGGRGDTNKHTFADSLINSDFHIISKSCIRVMEAESPLCSSLYDMTACLLCTSSALCVCARVCVYTCITNANGTDYFRSAVALNISRVLPALISAVSAGLMDARVDGAHKAIFLAHDVEARPGGGAEEVAVTLDIKTYISVRSEM